MPPSPNPAPNRAQDLPLLERFAAIPEALARDLEAQGGITLAGALLLIFVTLTMMECATLYIRWKAGALPERRTRGGAAPEHDAPQARRPVRRPRQSESAGVRPLRIAALARERIALAAVPAAAPAPAPGSAVAPTAFSAARQRYCVSRRSHALLTHDADCLSARVSFRCRNVTSSREDVVRPAGLEPATKPL